LLSVFWRVERWFSEDESVFLWLASQVRIDGFVPKLLDTFPVFDLTSSEQVRYLMCLLMRHGFVSDEVV